VWFDISHISLAATIYQISKCLFSFIDQSLCAYNMWISLYFMNTNQWTFHHNHISSICIAIHFIVKFHEYTLTYNFLVIRNAPCIYATMHSVVNPWHEKMTKKCRNLLYLQSMFLFCSSCLSSCHLTSSTSSKATSVVPFSWSAYPSAQLHTWGVTGVHEQVPIAPCNWHRMQSAWKRSMKTQAFWAANLFRCDVASRV